MAAKTSVLDTHVILEDYTTDHVGDISELYTGRLLQENVSEEITNRFYEEPGEVDPTCSPFAPTSSSKRASAPTSPNWPAIFSEPRPRPGSEPDVS